jgi:hypothetical protein
MIWRTRFAKIALADMMPPAIAMYLGPDHPFYYAPSCDLTVHVLGTTQEEWLLAECSRPRSAFEA